MLFRSNDTATTEIYTRRNTLSLHDALPISLPASNRLLEKYQYQYKLHRRNESEEDEYEYHTGRTLGRRQAIRDHWHCPFFRYYWNSGMSRLPTIDDCLECRPQGRQQGETSVFQRLGPRTRHNDRVRRPSRDDLELEEEDKYHRPRWCPDGLSHHRSAECSAYAIPKRRKQSTWTC